MAMTSRELLFLVVVLALAAFWVRQVLDLMGRRDDEFPGRLDKALWTAIILIGSLPGAFALWLFKLLILPPMTIEPQSPIRPPPR